eukprot:2240408-Amphidinium_carterae.1
MMEISGVETPRNPYKNSVSQKIWFHPPTPDSDIWGSGNTRDDSAWKGADPNAASYQKLVDRKLGGKVTKCTSMPDSMAKITKIMFVERFAHSCGTMQSKTSARCAFYVASPFPNCGGIGNETGTPRNSPRTHPFQHELPNHGIGINPCCLLHACMTLQPFGVLANSPTATRRAA